ncbi:ACP S-malonyltransferase [Desulfothermus okinawensis JCM 13304]
MQEKKICVLFPGQGSQEKGMGKDLADSDKDIMELWKKAEKISGAPLREIYWDGDEEEMVKTIYQQPALCVVGISLWEKYRPNVDFLAGHSVGEYPALIVSKVLGLDEGLKLVSLRGKLMYEAGLDSPGKMAAILKLTKEDVEKIVHEAASNSEKVLCIANYNSPKQLVISGDREAVEMAVEIAKQRRARAVVLPVSGAFHSLLMKDAAKELARYMDRFQFNNAEVPIFFNATALVETQGEKIKDIMKTQMISPVYFNQIIDNQWEMGVRKWLELGPKGILCGLLRRILVDKKEQWDCESIDS